jgi:hypothetical protein
MTLERSNKVMNIGRTKFTELVLEVLQLLTLEEFHYAIARLIKQITRQETLKEMEKIFASSVRSTSSIINLPISSIES